MARRYMKKYSTSAITTKMNFKTTRSYQLTPVRMALIKKIKDNMCQQGYEERNP